jgi:hypothetical protein
MTALNGYAELGDFKARLSELGVAGNSSDDGVIEGMIESASRLFDNLTFRRFYSTTADETRYYSATNRGRVFIDDLLTVTSIAVDTDYDRTYETTLASTDYLLCPDNAPLNGEPYTWIEIDPLSSNYFPTSRRGVKLIGTYGFCTTAPKDVNDAVLDICINRYQGRRGMGATGVSLVSGAGVVITAKDVTEFAWKVIMARRKNWGG